MRELVLESSKRVILSDTVGFISDLPTMLVAAFRATLEEVVEADLVLHVRDISHPETDAQRDDVETILKELALPVDGPDCNIIEVWNKVDLLDDEALELSCAYTFRNYAEQEKVLVKLTWTRKEEFKASELRAMFSE